MSIFLSSGRLCDDSIGVNVATFIQPLLLEQVNEEYWFGGSNVTDCTNDDDPMYGCSTQYESLCCW